VEEHLKSAWEIALEKTAKLKGDAGEEKLSPDQRKKINEIEKEHQAKTAEKEIMFQTNLKKLAREYQPAEFQQHAMVLNQSFAQEKESLQKEKEKKIEAIKREEVERE
jgi:hypothetical protein